MNDEEMKVWREKSIARHPNVPHHPDGERCDLSALCGPEDRCDCKDAEDEPVPACPPWCVTDHGAQPNYHSTAITTIEALDADLTVHLSFDDTADPEHLIELHVGHVVLLTSAQVRELMGALERLVGVERVAVNG